jgi:hypothetical protein
MRASRGLKAFTIIEFVIAMALTLLLLMLSSTALTGAQSVLADNRTRDASTTLALGRLELFKALGCGMQLGPTESTLSAAISTRCAKAVSLPEFTGDGTFTATDPYDSTRTMDLYFSTRWLSSSIPVGECPRESSSLPSMLERTITVVPAPARTPSFEAGQTLWKDLTGTVPASALGPYAFSSIEAVSSGGKYVSKGKGGILAKTVPWTKVTLGTDQGKVSRYAYPCKYPDGTTVGIAWFPYLTAGPYTVNGISVDAPDSSVDPAKVSKEQAL